jgi:cyclic pyranopterin phosphate synthase
MDLITLQNRDHVNPVDPVRQPRPSPFPERLVDSFGRVVTNLRISVTDRCNFRCVYCMPEEMAFYDRAEILTYEEILRVARIVVRVGVKKIRLTGGEPTVRRDLPVLVRGLVGIEGLRDLSMTTNGARLEELAQELYDAGLRRLNVSLDSLQRETFARLTRRDMLEKVIAGLMAAKRAGFHPIKVNAVAMRGATEHELLDFARLAREHDFDVRFIEFMPLDGDDLWERDRMLTAREIVETIHAVYPLERLDPGPTPDPATRYRFVDDGGRPIDRGRIGIIASVTEPFCAQCNRIRLTADGKLRTCLFSIVETDLRAELRGDATDEEIAWRIADAVAKKEAGHLINSVDFVKPERNMSQIGG